MQAREICAGAFPIAISIHFDEVEQSGWRPIFFRFVQHPCEGKRDLEKGPAIEAGEIDRGRLGPVINLQCEGAIRCSDHRLAHGRGPLSNGQGFPVLGFRADYELLETILPFENGADRQRHRATCVPAKRNR